MAIHGGRPVRKSMLSYGRQWIDKEDIKALVSVLKSEYLTTGPIVREFEQGLARYTGASYAVAFSSGTAALHAACYAAGIGAGDEVITTPMTFAASANCILYMGGKPIFADVDERTGCIDHAAIKGKITERTRAILPVHYTGQPANMDAIMELARHHGLTVIEDAAHAFGAGYRNRRVGNIGHMTMFSFHPVKHITTGEGGAITTNCPELYEKLLQFRTHGVDRSPPGLEQRGTWYYEMQLLGYNYRLTELQAALGLSQLKKTDKFLQLRREYARIYQEAFKDMREISPLHQDEAGESSWHIYVLRLNTALLTVGRREVYDALLRENIGVNVHYIPVYLHPYYRKLGYQPGLCPLAEQLYERMLTIPLYPRMRRKDVRDVIAAVKKVIGVYSKA